jgi:hypothetical protein
MSLVSTFLKGFLINYEGCDGVAFLTLNAPRHKIFSKNDQLERLFLFIRQKLFDHEGVYYRKCKTFGEKTW